MLTSDGREYLKRIRKVKPQVPALMIRGYNPAKETKITHDLHLQHITKPFFRTEVLSTIANAQ